MVQSSPRLHYSRPLDLECRRLDNQIGLPYQHYPLQQSPLALPASLALALLIVGAHRVRVVRSREGLRIRFALLLCLGLLGPPFEVFQVNHIADRTHDRRSKDCETKENDDESKNDR